MFNIRRCLYVMICISLLFSITACSQPTVINEEEIKDIPNVEDIKSVKSSERELMLEMGATLMADEVQYNMSANLDKKFLVYGMVELSDYYNYGFDNLEPDYFCIRVIPLKDSSISDSWYIYCNRESYDELFDKLIDGVVAGVSVSAIIHSNIYEEGQGNMAIAKSIIWF